MASNIASQLVFTGQQLIEASAGTGKTYTISNLCIRLLLGRDVPWQRPLAINEILILTFTIAATDELKQRIAGRIREAREAFRLEEPGEDPFLEELLESSADRSRDLKLLAAAGQMMDEASIFTIHGFCARVLGEQAFESGALFNLQMNAERDHLLKAASEDVFRNRILTLPAEIRDHAMTIWPNPERLADRLKGFLFRGELDFVPPYVELDPGELVSDALTAKKTWLAQQTETLLRGSDLKGNSKPMNRLQQMNDFCAEPGPGLSHELWQIYNKDSLEYSTKKNCSIPEHAVLDLIDKVSTDIEQLTANLWHELYHEVGTNMAMTKEDTNQLTVDDLLTSLAEAVNRDNSKLADTIRGRWPVAMIDEFQDTDDIQNSIFSRVYVTERPTDETTAMLMIGDPKQAIYNFRGADIYTYINARRSASNVSTLDANWRSTPDMVKATNYLFDKPDIFGNDEDIPFQAVSAARAGMVMKHGDADVLPYRVLVADDGGATTGNLVPITERLMSAAAEETVKLLTDEQITIEGKPVSAGQIAFLVRSRTHAVAAQRALRERNIQSVYLTLESVFLQDTAADLKLILEAILEPTSERAIRAALGTRLMLCSAADIERLTRDVEYQQQVLAEFRDYHELWLEQDIAPMLNVLATRRQLAEKWLQLPDGDRQLTNLRHLTEVLQQRASVAPGMFQLLKWFTQEQRDAETVSSEERQLRLESDDNLVKIVTMHAAKGLEYDIVMIPMPVFNPVSKKPYTPVIYHEESNGHFSSVIDLVPDTASQQRQDIEESEEEMRLLYVALTRAKYHCLFGLPGVSSLPKSALGRLTNLIDLGKDDHLETRARAALPDDLFDIQVTNPGSRKFEQPNKQLDSLVAPTGRPHLDDQWRIHSYTGVSSRLAATQALQAVSGFADDDISEDKISTTELKLTRHTFPRGARVGVVLHSLMEHIDFTESDQQEACLRTCHRLGLDEAWLPVLEQWLNDILDAPLGTTQLRKITWNDRLDEMEFHFPLATSGNLIEFLQETGYINPTRLENLDLEGMMTGMIDLLYRHEGRYFIVDYKSNHLGHDFSSYRPDKVAEAMRHHQYRLQYLIYTVAVHRMLSRTLPDYDYEQHLGGVYYLFLRGMKPDGSNGVYHDRPSLDHIETMNRLLTA